MNHKRVERTWKVVHYQGAGQGVSEVMDMVEKFDNQVIEPLEQAKIVTSETRNIANLPQYLDWRLVHLIID